LYGTIMEVGELLTDLTLTLSALHRRSVSHTGLTVPQSFVLSIVPSEGVDMSTLALRLGLDNSTVTRLVATLEKKNYLERRREEHDGRVVSVYLTEQGEETVTLLELSEDKLGEIVLESIPEEKRAQLKEILEEFLWNLSREQMVGGK